MSSRWQTWVGWWARTEHPQALAMVRVLLSFVLLLDFLAIYRHDLVVPLLAPMSAGGLGDPSGLEQGPWLYDLLPDAPSTAWLIWGVSVGLIAMVGLGWFARPAAFALVLVLANVALVLAAADRGIDMLIRNTLLVLAFSGADQSLSLRCRLQTGQWSAPASERISAWPRYLLIVQLFFVYFAAGVAKIASTWTPFGGFAALYIAMRDPAFQVLPGAWVRELFPLTQLLTAVTWVWEWSAPLLLIGFWFRETRLRPGRFRALCNRLNVVGLYLGIGAVFHLGTHAVLELGIFPWAVMSLYPAAVHSDRWRVWGDRLAGWLVKRKSSGDHSG